MLKKLIKHELKATSREFFLLYIALLALTILNKVFLVINDNTDLLDSRTAMGKFLNTLYGIIIFTYVMLCMTVLILTTVLVLMRFYKNLTGEEGYLMFTLPVPTWMLVVSKLIAATLWQMLSIFLFIISITILFWGNGFWRDFLEFIGEIKENSSSSTWTQVILFIIITFIAVLVSLLYKTTEYYFCIAIGHLAKKHRIATAIGTYFVYNFLKQVFYSILIINNIDLLDSISDKLNRLSGKGEIFIRVFLTYLNTYSAIIIGISILFGIILCYLTTTIFKKRLNLE